LPALAPRWRRAGGGKEKAASAPGPSGRCERPAQASSQDRSWESGARCRRALSAPSNGNGGSVRASCWTAAAASFAAAHRPPRKSWPALGHLGGRCAETILFFLWGQALGHRRKRPPQAPDAVRTGGHRRTPKRTQWSGQSLTTKPPEVRRGPE